MRVGFIITLFSVLFSQAQDKLVLTNGKLFYGKLLSVSSKSVFIVLQDSSTTSALDRTQVLFIENSNGEVRIFGNRENEKSSKSIKELNSLPYRNVLGGQPLGVFIGRLSLTYERLSKNGQFGLVIPFSLTFDPSAFYPSVEDSAATPSQPTPGVNFITGADLNYYLQLVPGNRGFMGPRIRYGTDQLMGGLEGFSFQYQLGWSYWSVSKLVQHLSIGYGFVKLLNIPAGSTINPDQLYAWFSVNYRIGFRW